jgi:hypothetical protein
LYYFAFNVALLGLRNRFSYVFATVQRPVVILSFSVAFIMLPFPITYSIYGFIGGLSPILLVFAWVIPIVGLVLVFYGLRGQFPGGGGQTPQQLPPPPPPPGGGQPPQLPPNVQATLQAAVFQLNQSANNLQNLLNP